MHYKTRYLTMSCILVLLALVCGLHFSAWAKQKTNNTTTANPRIKNLSTEDTELFNALTKKQQQDIAAGKVAEGYNEWMVRLALGSPYYNTEHHPVYTDYEQVWLYTKQVDERQEKKEQIVDPQNNWPTIHKYVWVKTCTIGDFFVLFDRGVVEKIVKDTSEKRYGSCSISTHEEYIPIVNESTSRRRKVRVKE